MGTGLWEKEMSCTKAWESPTPSRGTPKITGGLKSFDYMRGKLSNKIRVKAFPSALLAFSSGWSSQARNNKPKMPLGHMPWVRQQGLLLGVSEAGNLEQNRPISFIYS